jgi:hypothetical protein
MTTNEINKVIQKKYMLGRFGTLKTYTLLYLYKDYFLKTMINYFYFIHNDDNNSKKDKIENVKKMYNYMFYNQDIYINSNLIETARKKLFEFSLSDPQDFVPILEKVGYICNHTTRKGNKCHKKCDNFECKIHKNCTIRFKDRIKKYLELPTVLTNIVLSYVFPVY